MTWNPIHHLKKMFTPKDDLDSLIHQQEQERQRLGASIEQLDADLKATIQDGIGLTGHRATLNRERYENLSIQKKMMEKQFADLGGITNSLVYQRQLAQSHEYFEKLIKSNSSLSDPNRLTELQDRIDVERSHLDAASRQINEARREYIAHYAPAKPDDEDDEYTRLVAEARAAKQEESAVPPAAAPISSAESLPSPAPATLTEGA